MSVVKKIRNHWFVTVHTARGYIKDREEQPKLRSQYKIDYKEQVIEKLWRDLSIVHIDLTYTQGAEWSYTSNRFNSLSFFEIPTFVIKYNLI